MERITEVDGIKFKIKNNEQTRRFICGGCKKHLYNFTTAVWENRVIDKEDLEPADENVPKVKSVIFHECPFCGMFLDFRTMKL